MITLKHNRKKASGNSSRNNSAGFTLFELLIVMTIITIVVSLAGMSLSVIYHARAKSAAETVGAMISQCKVNNLSGKATDFELYYDTDEGYYVCELRDASKSMRPITKIETFGNEKLTLNVSGTKLSAGDCVHVTFSTTSGAVTSFQIGTVDNSTQAFTGSKDYSGETSNYFQLSSGSDYKITLYKATGTQLNDWEAD